MHERQQILQEQQKELLRIVDVENFAPEVRQKVAQLKIEARLKQLQEIRFFQPLDESEEEKLKLMRQPTSTLPFSNETEYLKKIREDAHYARLKRANRHERNQSFNFDFFDFMDKCRQAVWKQEVLTKNDYKVNKDRKNSAERRKSVSNALQFKMKGMMDAALRNKQMAEANVKSFYQMRQMNLYKDKNLTEEQIYKLESDVRTMYDK